MNVSDKNNNMSDTSHGATRVILSVNPADAVGPLKPMNAVNNSFALVEW